MTEVKPSPTFQNHGLFTTKQYTRGDVILQEKKPLFVTNSSHHPSLSSQFINQKIPSPPSSTPPSQRGQWTQMIKAAAAFALYTTDRQDEILSLYHPPLLDDDEGKNNNNNNNGENNNNSNNDESSIINLSQSILQQTLPSYTAPNTPLFAHLHGADDPTRLQRAMLVAICNAFEGGIVFQTASRVNHSCDPNSLVSFSNDDEITVRCAVSSLPPGTEVTISYLGILIWSDRDARRETLRRDKLFVCHCHRCDGTKEDEYDEAAAIPCGTCHERRGRFWTEDVQWEDNGDVSYAYPKYEEDSMDVGGRCYVCRTCGGKSTVDRRQVQRVTSKIVNRLSSSTTTTASAADDAAEREMEMDEQLYHLSLSLLGARHYATLLMQYALLQRDISRLNAQALTGEEYPSLEDLAECVDNLGGLWDYGERLGLGGTTASAVLWKMTVDVGRMLVGLGDEKSQKFGGEWVERVKDYVDGFEGEEMKKVVEGLRLAWTRNKGSSSSTLAEEEEVEVEMEEGNKRIKTCH